MPINTPQTHNRLLILTDFSRILSHCLISYRDSSTLAYVLYELFLFLWFSSSLFYHIFLIFGPPEETSRIGRFLWIAHICWNWLYIRMVGEEGTEGVWSNWMERGWVGLGMLAVWEEGRMWGEGRDRGLVTDRLWVMEKERDEVRARDAGSEVYAV